MKRAFLLLVASVGLFVLTFSVCTLRAKGQQATVSNPAVGPKVEARRAVGIVRVINTAEVVTCRTKGGKLDETMKFLSWPELLNAPCFKEAQGRFSGRPSSQASEVSFSPGPEIVPGLELRLVVSPDGSHYNLTLSQKSDDRCGFAFFSDERGVIYEGYAIGCGRNPQEIQGKP